MTDQEPGPMGCYLDQAATEATLVRLISSGELPIFGDRPTLKGTWSRLKSRGVKAVLLPKLMEKYFPGRGADFQNGSRGAKPAPDEGTCVGRGTYKACNLSYLAALDSRQIPGRPVIIAYEPIYAGARMKIGKGRIRGGGAVGAWAGEFCSRYGTICRGDAGDGGRWPLPDTPIGRTDLASSWGRKGLPEDITAACGQHKFEAHYCRSVEEQMDALAAGFAGAFCRGTLNGSRDKYGMSRPGRSGAHCEAVVGVFVAHNGEDAILMQNSWNNQPSGGSVLHIDGGERYELPQGVYGIMASDQRRVWKSFAESWHFQPGAQSAWH
jgi:hypothetical protein